MTDATPKAIDDCHELPLWMIPQLDKFPRNRRINTVRHLWRLAQARQRRAMKRLGGLWDTHGETYGLRRDIPGAVSFRRERT